MSGGGGVARVRRAATVAFCSTALLLAVESGNAPIRDLLLAQTGDVGIETADDAGRVPLAIALFERADLADAAAALVVADADVNRVDERSGGLRQSERLFYLVLHRQHVFAYGNRARQSRRRPISRLECQTRHQSKQRKGLLADRFSSRRRLTNLATLFEGLNAAARAARLAAVTRSR